ncbi:MAG: DUF4440 domain-containing protein [Candidatus Roizmanbacteria bacterium]
MKNNVEDITIGKGKLAGKGIYANRDFREGELVLYWNLKKLSQIEFDKLPKSEHMFVHSFFGEMYLFPAPSRYTNHATNPNTCSDFKAKCEYTIRPIKKGEMITTNATDEITYELETFLEAYEKAANSRDFTKVNPLIAEKAVFTFTEGVFEGKEAIKKAFEDTWQIIRKEKYSVTDVKWIKKGYRNAVYEYIFKSDGWVKGKRQVRKGKGTNILKRMSGSWRILKEYLQHLD